MALDEALQRLLAQAQPLARVESVSTFDADGRVLAADLVSALQVPHRFLSQIFVTGFYYFILRLFFDHRHFSAF